MRQLLTNLKQRTINFDIKYQIPYILKTKDKHKPKVEHLSRSGL